MLEDNEIQVLKSLYFLLRFSLFLRDGVFHVKVRRLAAAKNLFARGFFGRRLEYASLLFISVWLECDDAIIFDRLPTRRTLFVLDYLLKALKTSLALLDPL